LLSIASAAAGVFKLGRPRLGADIVGDWSDEQNDAIVADYFAMLGDDIAGRP